ncbi:amidohydrolase [Pontibacter sp. G13]|uniref:amidohydrolase n=1 Tax=Pontibacter sp. G13 TaxID=3074898 RepID=UPI00288A6922|nr:amidohydrolase [Pontibacter sp. G13]WNJ16281.1 amidohydrolase [Pontibacter sp. G13]
MNRFLLGLMGLLFATGVVAQTQTGSLMIKHGTVMTITDGTLEDTDILVVDGKIKKIGQNLKTPNGVQEIDATGQYVMPGIIDAHSHIGISAVNEATNPVTAEVWVGDALDPMDVSLYRALAGGVTISHAMHGSANAIGGQCETIKHRYGTVNPEELRMEGAPRTIKFALGENPIRVHGIGKNIQPRTRMGIEQVFRSAFAEAQAYAEEWKAYEKEKKSNPAAIAPAYSLRKETIAGILSGEVLIHCHSYRADEILMLMNVCKDYGVNNITFQHVNEGFKVAPELAEFGASASVFSDWWAYKFEVYYSTAYNASILTKNGVTTSINSDSDELIRHLNHEAAKTQRYGSLSDEEALKLITLNPAKQLGISDRVGSIEVGKEGDFAIFSANPLSVYAINQMTIVDGVIRFDIENDPDDMRLYADPEETLQPVFSGNHGHDHERCMQDVREMLFGY